MPGCEDRVREQESGPGLVREQCQRDGEHARPGCWEQSRLLMAGQTVTATKGERGPGLGRQR